MRGIVILGLVTFAMLPVSLIFLVSGLGQLYAMHTNPWKHGYTYGILAGRASARDSSPACGGYNSTSTSYDECINGYDLGFLKGCKEYGYKIPPTDEHLICPP